jgi:hypothetical protein
MATEEGCLPGVQRSLSTALIRHNPIETLVFLLVWLRRVYSFLFCINELVDERGSLPRTRFQSTFNMLVQ